MIDPKSQPRLGNASQIGLVILAAGSSTRFGHEDKLAADLDGKPVAQHVLHAVEPFDWGNRVVVCSPTSIWKDAFIDAGFSVVENDDRNGGMLSSLHLGASANRELPYTLIALADMPFITGKLLESLISEIVDGKADAVASRSENYRGPPAIFRTEMLAALPKEGEGGARQLLANARFVDCAEETLRDIDTQADLALAQTVRVLHNDVVSR